MKIIRHSSTATIIMYAAVLSLALLFNQHKASSTENLNTNLVLKDSNNREPREIWCHIDLPAPEKGPVLFDLYYDENAINLGSFIYLKTMIIYTSYGRANNMKNDLISGKEILINRTAFIIDTNDGQVAMVKFSNLFADGTILSYKFEGNETFWFQPPESSLGHYYVKLAKRLLRYSQAKAKSI